MTTPVNFGGTVAGVRTLVLDTFTDATRIGSPTPRVDDARVTAWLTEGAAEVALAVLGYDRLGASWEDVVEARARGLVELYAAAMLLDTTHPERAPTGGRLADVWWERHRAGLAALTASVSSLLNRLERQEDAPKLAPLGTISTRPASGWEQQRW